MGDRAEGIHDGDGAGLTMSGRLPENVACFARALRIAGVPVGPGAVVEAVAALADGALGAREDV
jgi:uncharacterized protein with von Willebrand factor type A (vWA) domain